MGEHKGRQSDIGELIRLAESPGASEDEVLAAVRALKDRSEDSFLLLLFKKLSAKQLVRLAKNPEAGEDNAVRAVHALKDRPGKDVTEQLKQLSATCSGRVRHAAHSAFNSRNLPEDVKGFLALFEQELAQADRIAAWGIARALIEQHQISSRNALLARAKQFRGELSAKNSTHMSAYKQLELLIPYLEKNVKGAEKAPQMVEMPVPNGRYSDESSGGTPALSRLMKELAADDSPAGNGHKASPTHPPLKPAEDSLSTAGVMDWKTVVVEMLRKNAGDEAAKAVEHLMKSRTPASLRQLQAIMEERVSGIPADTPEKQNIRIALRALNLQPTSGTARTPPKTPQR